MKSITIHDMDDELAARLDRQAREEGSSLNKLVKRLLARALGLGSVLTDRRRDFEPFCGTWSAKEAGDFREATLDLERADPRDWA
jgi:hypothetical protein